MIKYLELEGYTNFGEVQMCSHVYQFRQKEVSCPIIILIYAYAGSRIFKGLIFDKSKTYKTLQLTKTELTKIEEYTGKLKECDLEEFIKDTIVEEQLKNYVKTEEAQDVKTKD
jgi:hypothetical protein